MMASKSCLEVLLQHHVELELLLKDVHFLKLSKNLLRSKVLSKEASERFASLDPDPEHLEPEVKVRYLLQHAYERVREDDSVYDRLISVLSKFGGELNTLCGAMRREVVQECTSRGDELEDTELVEQDVSYLVKILVSYCHLWDAIGIALNLPKHKREDCGEGKENVNRLSNILTTWILGSYEGARPATLHSLREALASEIVGLGRLARQLMTYKRVDDLVTVVKPQYIGPYITYQSDDTEVSEGKSTLLEVQVSCSENVSCQWSKDGEPLLDGADFSGVCSNILYINKASQRTEGKYSCCVSRGNENEFSDEMILSVLYPPEKKQLLEFFSLPKSEVAKESWPPVGNITFINLVLIEQKQKPMSTCDYYTVRGDMDDIVESKEVAKYEEVFREYREGALVLVEGRPGSGKTTLVHKLTRDWATGKKVLQGVKMVFLITLRLLNVSERDKSLLDLLKIYYSETFSEKMEQNLQECRGKEVCFILDGLDEYPIKSKQNLIIDQLLYTKTFLPHCMVIVASRPVATDKLREICKMRIEVVGFSKDQIYSYVNSYPFGDLSLSMQCKMTEYLDQHPNVFHMCYLPVHAAMICFLFSNLKGKISHRETQIYEQFTIATLLRHRANRERTPIKSLKDLRGEEKLLFNSVCKLAFDMITNSQQAISKSDTQVSFSNDSVLGLLTVESASKHYGIEDFYAFHHLTFQEFLAAFHILEAQCVISELVEAKGFYNVLKFYCGLCGSSNIEACKKILLAPNYCNKLFYKAQCAYESQQVELCDYVINDGVIRLHNVIISCTDFIALVFVISNTSKLVERMSILDCWLDSEGVRAFYSVANEKKLYGIKLIKVCPFTTNYPLQEISDHEIETLNCFLKIFPVFEELDLIEVTLSISQVQQLTREVHLPHVKVLKISLNNEFISCPEETFAFCGQNIRKVYFSVQRRLMINDIVWRKILHCAIGCQEVQKIDTTSWIYLYNSDKFSAVSTAKLSRCTDIVLVNCCISDKQTKMLADFLNTSLLTNLVLDYNRISDLGAIALAGSLAKCTVLQEFSIQFNSIGDSGATSLADALVHCSSLRKLFLQGNSLGDNGAVAIAKTTSNLSGLDLYLHNINITEEGIDKVLVQRPSTYIRIMALSSSWYSIIETGVDTLRHALCCGNVPQLNLSSTNTNYFEELIVDGLISVRGLDVSLNKENIYSLCKIIDSLTALNYLQCCIHDISTDDCQLLCDCLERCNTLTKLDLNNIRYSTILNMVKQKTNLHSLCLSCCQLESEYIVTSFFNSSSSLQSLKLHNCSIGKYDACALSEGLAHCKSLHYLDLSMNCIGDVGAIAIANALMDHTSLLELKVAYNCITLLGMRALAHVFKNNHLQCINFAGNNIPLGAVVLFKTTCVHILQYLDLSTTGFGVHVYNIAILSIGLMMYKQLTQLTQLHISGNNIRSSGLIILAEGLKCCTNLRVLSLDSNNIEADGVAAMLPVMEHCKYLNYLGFKKNNIGVSGAAVLVGGWQHKSPMTVDLHDCFHNKHKYALLDVMKCCSECDHLLELYYANDYVCIEIDCRSIPKLIIP